MPIRVLTWGTFDRLHKDHVGFLRCAARLGDELHVVVVPDEIVRENKGRAPLDSASVRKDHVSRLDFVTAAYIDSLSNQLKGLNGLIPDLICIGYDQDSRWADELLSLLRQRGQNPILVRLPRMGSMHTTELLKSLKGKLADLPRPKGRPKRETIKLGSQEKLTLLGGSRS